MKKKSNQREYWIVESEFGWDVKRYLRTICGSEKEAWHFKRYLDEKNPTDKHEIILVKEVSK